MSNIVGTPQGDVLLGTGGNDTFDGGAGNDAMSGGFGDDTYIIADAGDEIVEGQFQGTDTAIAQVEYRLSSHVENLQLAGSTTGFGNDQDNILQGNASNNLLAGLGGNDLLFGADGNDTLFGNSGSDRLYGGDGDDTLIGGAGFDELYGGVGNDTYITNGYNFKIIERPGGLGDTLHIPGDYDLGKTELENLLLLGRARFGTGNSRNNTISGNGMPNVLSGLTGSDTLFGRRGDDTLFGNQGNDALHGGEGNDQLYGQQGNDSLNGDRGNDVLSGELGRDVLTGFGGGARERDTLIGGAEADVFVLGVRGRRGAHYLGSGFAIIQDFSRAQGDKIQVNGLANNYTIDISQNRWGGSNPDAAIFRGRDLLAIVQDTTAVGLRDLIATPLR